MQACRKKISAFLNPYNLFIDATTIQVGLPAKSSRAGTVIVVVPNVMGICCYSPALDSIGISCRGLQFCQVKLFQYLVCIFTFKTLVEVNNCIRLLHFVFYQQEFVNVFNFHNYDYLTSTTEKLDPRKWRADKEVNNCFNLLSSAAAGDVTAVTRYILHLSSIYLDIYFSTPKLNS